MFRRAIAPELSSDTKVPSQLWPSALMDDISPLLVCVTLLARVTLAHCFSGEDLAINLWDIGSGNCIKKMTGHTSSIYSLAFSAESSLLVSTSSDWTVRCWDVKSAGGLSSKPRENGMSVDGPTINGQPHPGKDDLGIET
jgi:WD40 repeat protein